MLAQMAGHRLAALERIAGINQQSDQDMQHPQQRHLQQQSMLGSSSLSSSIKGSSTLSRGACQ
jgi:hypothetical protein